MAADPRQMPAAPSKGKASCGVLLFRLSRASGEGLGDALAEVGLRAPAYAILQQLYEAGPISQQALGRALRIHASNLVALIDELEAAGSVIRRRDPDDRRRYLLELTDEGLRRLAKAETVTRAAEAQHARPAHSRRTRSAAALSDEARGAFMCPPRPLRRLRRLRTLGGRAPSRSA